MVFSGEAEDKGKGKISMAGPIEDILEADELWEDDDEEFEMHGDAEEGPVEHDGEDMSEDEDEEEAEMVIEQPFGYGDEPAGALLDLSNADESPRRPVFY